MSELRAWNFYLARGDWVVLQVNITSSFCRVVPKIWDWMGERDVPTCPVGSVRADCQRWDDYPYCVALLGQE